ncbi:tetratricopeptide repeat protein [Planctomycetes bacterium K23_9]|uniref:Tetratricopeptide repeat protein n=1 Tax=Stieleria marina TaxID=1930275 RepID=A0A517NZ70_9BACT|nr:hypothetical protein K239x_44180 [Planctomycetes bacterium K23_9]
MNSRIQTSIFLFALAIGNIYTEIPSTADAQQAALSATDRETVLAIVDQLSNRRFQRRQNAEEELWAMGPAIEPLLIEATKNANLETRERIRFIREKFDLGITPEMPADARRWITTAINSRSDKQRREATAELAKIGYFAATLKVLQRLDSPQQRSEYLSMIMTQTRTTKPSTEQDDFHFRLLGMAVNEANPRDASRMIGYVLRASQVRQRATQVTWITKFVDLVGQCPNATARRSLIDGIYFDSKITSGAISTDLLVKWIDLVADEPDRMSRFRHVSKLLSTSALISSYGSSSRAPRFKIDELFNRLSPQGRNALLDTTANVSSALTVLHQKVGDQALLKAAAHTKDELIRGNLIGRLAALPSWPAKKSADEIVKHDVLSLIDNEPDGPARHQIVTGYLQGLGRRSSRDVAPSREVIRAIWNRMTTQDDHAWQLMAIVETYSSEQHFGAMHDKATIEKMLRCAKLASTKDTQTLAYSPISKKHLAAELKKHRMAMPFIRTLDSLPSGANLGSRFSSLLGASQFTNALYDREERRSLLAFVEKHSDSRSRRYAATGILRNKTLLKQLLNEGEFERVKKTLVGGADEKNRGDMLGKLYANGATIEYLVANKRMHEVLDFDTQNLAANYRESVLTQLVGSDDAVTALLNAGHYDSLLKSIENIDNDARQKDLMRRLMTRKAYARVLATQGSLAANLLELSRNKTWMASRGYVNLITNLHLKDLAAEPKLALSFWDLATQLPREYDRRECIKALFASDWFFTQVLQNQRLDEIVAVLPKTLSATAHRSVVSDMLRKPGAAFFFQDGHLPWLVKLCLPLRDVDQLSSYRSIGYSTEAQKWFSGPNQPERLIREFQSIDRRQRGKFAAAFLESGILSKQSKNKTLATKLIKFASAQPVEVQRPIALVLLTQYTTSAEAAKSDLANVVIRQLETEAVEYEYLRKALYASSISRKLLEQKKLRSIIARCLNWPDGKERLVLGRTLLLNVYYQKALTDTELKTLAAPLFEGTESTGTVSTYLNSSTLVGRLVDLGFYDQLRDVVDAPQSNATTFESRRWTFYTNPSVVERARIKDPKATVLVKLIQDTRTTSLYSRMTQLGSNAKAFGWFLDGQGITPVASVIQRIDVRSRSSLIRMLTTSSNISREIEKRDLMPGLLEIEGVRETVVKDGSYLSIVNSALSRQSKSVPGLLPILKAAYQEDTNPSRRSALLVSLGRWELQTALIDHGDGRWLLDVMGEQHKNNSDKPNARRQLESTLGQPTGLYSLAIRVGDYQAAERLLLQLSDTDQGKLRLIRFRMLMKRFGKSDLAPPSQPTQSQPTDLDQSQRYRYFLLRSQNLDSRPPLITSKLADPVIHWTDAIENHRYDELSTLPVPSIKEMPNTPVKSDINPVHRRVEQLGFQIVAKQLAGLYSSKKTEDADIKQLTDLVESHPQDIHLHRYVADALLSANRPRLALALLDDKLPRRAMYWHWERLDFDRALQSIKWDPHRCNVLFDDVRGQAKPSVSNQRRARDFLLQVAILLKGAGMTADVQAVINTLRQHAAESLDAKSRREYLVSLATRMHQLGFKSAAHHTLAEFTNDLSVRSRYFLTIYHSDQFQASWRESLQWWDEFARRYPNETAVERLVRIDNVMSGQTPLAELGMFPQSKDDRFGNRPQTPETDSVPVTHFRYQQYALARKNAQATDIPQHNDWILIGRTHLAEDNFADAAQAFREAWKLRPLDLTRLYLAGDCWQKAGKTTAANQCKQQARLLALTMGNEFGLALGLQQEGLDQDAIQIHRDLLTTTLPGHKTHINAIPLVARNSPDTAKKLQLWQSHDLYHLRPTQFHTNLRRWVFQAAQRHALRAELAIDHNDFQTAQTAWQDMAAVGMGNTRLIVPLLQKLEAKGQTELSDKIFDAHHSYLHAALEKHPDSPAIKEHVGILRDFSKQTIRQDTVQ